LKAAAAVAPQDRDVVGVKVGNRKVYEAVPVEVCAGYCGGVRPYRKPLPGRESAVSVAQQDRDDIIFVLCGYDVRGAADVDGGYRGAALREPRVLEGAIALT
jgi:hypothetical protein